MTARVSSWSSTFRLSGVDSADAANSVSPEGFTPTGRHKVSLQRGFSLPEVIVALGLVMATALPTIGVLALGLGDARVAATQHSVEALRGTVRACLQDPAWPVATTEKTWSHSLYFDSKGAETRHRQQADASIEARMTAAPGLGFDSPGLETVKVEFLAVPSGEILGTCLVQRTRPDLLAANLLP